MTSLDRLVEVKAEQGEFISVLDKRGFRKEASVASILLGPGAYEQTCLWVVGVSQKRARPNETLQHLVQQEAAHRKALDGA